LPSITITLSQQTIAGLLDGKYRLLAFQAVNTVAPGAMPLVWYQTTHFTTSTVVSWSDAFMAYASQSQISSYAVIQMDSEDSIALGDTVAIETGFLMQPQPGGQAGAVSIINQDPRPCTAGIGQAAAGAPSSPICAVPLNSHAMAVIQPTNEIFLMFLPMAVPNGTVLTQAIFPGILVDFENQTTAEVGFSLDGAWSGKGQKTPPNTDLVPLLTG
jgi:hypothetical protein